MLTSFSIFSNALMLLLFLTPYLPTALPVIANTPCGPVLGESSPAANGTVAAFLGLRFGNEPIRFSSASPAPCWTGTFNASTLGPSCVQNTGAGTEDCLFLSVFSPLLPSTLLPSNLPVHVYIHGGSLIEGSGNTDASSFSARANVVSVVIQYRLTWSGWLLTRGFSSDKNATGNVGVLDMQLALRWVRDNIKGFGGDASRITLAGQSSGGTAIFALLSAPSSRGLFHRAIALSGSPNISMSRAEKLSQDTAFVIAAGCGSLTPTAELTCLRAADIATLTSAQLKSWQTPGIFSVRLPAIGGFNSVYGGLAVVDGSIIPAPFEDAFALGTVDVPVILSGQAQECDLGPGDDVRLLTNLEWRAWLEARAILGGWGAESAAALASALYESYAAEMSVGGAQRAYDTINADYGTACAWVHIATRAKKEGRSSPVYLAVNAWQPSIPLGRDVQRPLTMAYHMHDWLVGFELWPTPTNTSAVYPGAPDKALAALLQGAWASLMHDGVVDPARSGGWRSVEDVPAWPASYGSLRITSADLPPFLPTAFVTDQRAHACAIFKTFNMTSAGYWWVN
jgi:carboxylesterase type B